MTRTCDKCRREVGLDARGRKIRHFCKPIRSWRKFPETDTHRHGLSRSWGAAESSEYAVWILANPSTADGRLDDPTIAEVCRFTEDVIGLEAAIVVNIYAKRATNPKCLKGMDDLVDSTDQYIADALDGAKVCMVGWGTCLVGVRHQDVALDDRVKRVGELISEAKLTAQCLGRNEATRRTRVATPWHPLKAARNHPRPITLQEWKW